MASDAQIGLIEDILEELGWTRNRLGWEEAHWEDFESLSTGQASEVIDWLREQKHG
jgi:hypothetical protein